MFKVLKEAKENGGVLANGGTEQLKKWPLADDFAALMREHLVAKEMLAHSEEQLRDMKAEQSNTRVRGGRGEEREGEGGGVHGIPSTGLPLSDAVGSQCGVRCVCNTLTMNCSFAL